MVTAWLFSIVPWPRDLYYGTYAIVFFTLGYIECQRRPSTRLTSKIATISPAIVSDQAYKATSAGDNTLQPDKRISSQTHLAIVAMHTPDLDHKMRHGISAVDLPRTLDHVPSGISGLMAPSAGWGGQWIS